MKWNIVIGSLVLGLGLSTQGFGFDLLDRMLGMDYDGGGSKTKMVDPGCGNKAVQKSCTPLLDRIRCHLATKPHQKGGCDEKLVDPGCIQKGDPKCVQKGDPCGGCNRCTPLLDNLRCRLASLRSCGVSGKGGKIEDPGCIQKGTPKCTQKSRSCGSLRGSLLDRIFSCRAQHGKSKGVDCCEPSWDKDFGPVPAAPEAAVPEAAPTPPAPVVDPSAFLPTNRRFIQTTLVR
jgi:hypothetical protein